MPVGDLRDPSGITRADSTITGHRLLLPAIDQNRKTIPDGLPTGV